ncbi:MAG: hypothetical protein SH820_14885 [Xanthomonadales bacterium]|nr:hypothetical protein [Xanthomonadales bacterium]
MKTKATPAPLANSVDDTCYRLNICRATFYKQVKKGKIKVVKYGSSTKVLEPELQRVAIEGF